MAYLQKTKLKTALHINPLENGGFKPVIKIEKQIKNKPNSGTPNKIYNSALSEKFMNLLMVDGKKIKAYNIFYESLKHLEKTNISNFTVAVPQDTKGVRFSPPGVNKQSLFPLPFKGQGNVALPGTVRAGTPKIQSVDIKKDVILARNIIFEAVTNVKPSVEVRKVRKGGITYLVPAIIPIKRQETLAIRWLIDSAKNRKKKSRLSFAECLALEFIDACKKVGKPRQRRDELHKLAESNRAYIRFRWW
jgi:ribosomal protein S7